MGYNCNCIYSRGTAVCSNKNIKRSWFAFGDRLCHYYYNPDKCKYNKAYTDTKPPPPPPPLKTAIEKTEATTESKELKALFYVIEGMCECYRNKNYGDANDWLRHIDDAYSDYQESTDNLIRNDIKK